jgi:ParB/RepB/Spo0J family partition protein
MTKTATKTKKETASAGEGYKEIEVGNFNPDTLVNGDNARTNYDIKELAANIAKVGVLQPVILRQDPDGGYILVAGHRRVRAAIEAGLKIIPGRVLDLNEEQAREVQTLENLQREALNPMDEAQAFKQLLDNGGYNVKALAERVDKSETYVYRAISLLSLPEDVRDAIRDGRITPAHGHQLLRVPADKREEAAEEMLEADGSLTVSELAEKIEQDYGCRLSGACFDKAACGTCQYNDANQKMLFDGAGQDDEGRCTNTACFNEKTETFHNELADLSAKKFKGMKYLGQKTMSYGWIGGHSVYNIGKNTAVIKDELTKKPEIKEAMKKTPERFGFYVDTGEHKAFAVITDKALIAELWPSDRGPASKTPEQREAEEKDAYFEMHTLKALVRELLVSTYSLHHNQAVQLVPDYLTASVKEAVTEALGLKDWSEVVPNDLDTNLIFKLLWLMKMDENTYSVPELVATFKSAIGLDLKAIKAAAQKTAKDNWKFELERRKTEAAVKKQNADKKVPLDKKGWNEDEDGDNE